MNQILKQKSLPEEEKNNPIDVIPDREKRLLERNMTIKPILRAKKGSKEGRMSASRSSKRSQASVLTLKSKITQMSKESFNAQRS